MTDESRIDISLDPAKIHGGVQSAEYWRGTVWVGAKELDLCYVGCIVLIRLVDSVV